MKANFINKIATVAVFVLTLLEFSLFQANPVMAGWRVNPIRLDFDQRARSGVISLSNDGDEKITFATESVEWTQDESGKDIYTPTDDLVVFPKFITIEPKQERVIRTGIRVPATVKEKTYRLFIKEAGERKKTEGTAVAIALRFGVPIFAKPLKELVKGEIQLAKLEEGKAQVTIVNTGNSHFRINDIHLTGKNADGITIFSQEVNGWYLLAGASRVYTVPIDENVCLKLQTIDIEVDANQMKLNGKINVDKAVCHPKR